MASEIKVGDWIRTDDGRIYQVDSSNDEWALSDIFYKVIVKHSSNLIDLICEGDYVNGKEVTEIKEWNSSKDGYFRYAVTCHYEIIRADEIKTIATKEMMESISYKVKE